MRMQNKSLQKKAIKNDRLMRYLNRMGLRLINKALIKIFMEIALFLVDSATTHMKQDSKTMRNITLQIRNNRMQMGNSNNLHLMRKTLN